MDRALHISSSNKRERITSIDCQSGVLRLHIFPFASAVILDLQSGDRLAEKQSPRAKICQMCQAEVRVFRRSSRTSMTLQPELRELKILFRSVLGILHVAQMVLAFELILMHISEEVFRELQSDRQ